MVGALKDAGVPADAALEVVRSVFLLEADALEFFTE